LRDIGAPVKALLDYFPALDSEVLAQFEIVKQQFQFGRQGRRVPRRHEQPAHAVLDQLLNPVQLRGDHRNAHGHGFFDHVRQNIAVAIGCLDAGQRENHRPLVMLAQDFLRQGADHFHATANAAASDPFFERLGKLPRADQFAGEFDFPLFQKLAGRDEITKTFFLHQPAYA
jgi:hypothetical protein